MRSHRALTVTILQTLAVFGVQTYVLPRKAQL